MLFCVHVGERNYQRYVPNHSSTLLPTANVKLSWLFHVYNDLEELNCGVLQEKEDTGREKPAQATPWGNH
jgi:hypothetical protein